MSDLYITEPPTSGKVILETNYGNIDIELFTLEAPKSCKNFIQHCLNKYYNGCHFFKILKNFMIQTGDPTNTGSGGESIYSSEFIILGFSSSFIMGHPSSSAVKLLIFTALK